MALPTWSAVFGTAQKTSCRILLSSRLKYNLFDRLIVSGNLLVALNEGGLRQRITPLIGLSYSF
jgi:hypothetical protein